LMRKWEIDYDRSFPGVIFNQLERNAIERLITPRNESMLKRHVKNIMATAYALLGERTRMIISSQIMKSRKIVRRDIRSYQPDKNIQSLSGCRRGLSFKHSSMPVLFSHDVDYKFCYSEVIKLGILENKKGVKATYNFLVNAGYSIDTEVLKELDSMGHEIGLHGYTYDLRVAFRKPKTIYSRLENAKNCLESKLGKRIQGFRNHSLEYSFELLDVIDRLGFKYESGIYPKQFQDNFNTFFCWPFYYKGKQLVEIPVIWPIDTDLFRTFNFSDQEALQYTKERLNQVASLGGVAGLLYHPSIISTRMSFFSGLIDFVLDNDFEIRNYRAFAEDCTKSE